MTTKKNRSRFGIASLVLGIATPILLILFLLLVVGTGLIDKKIETGFGLAWVVFAVCAPLLHFTGLVFGAIGIASKDVGKAVPVAGALINSFLGLLGLTLIYLIISNLRFGFH